MMNPMNNLINILSSRFSSTDPIFLQEILDLCPTMSRRTVFNKIKQALASGQLAKQSRGVYYIPKQTALGPSSLSPLATLVKKYITDGDNVFGYWSGLMLENQEGLTTQNPAVLEITTNKATKRLVRLGPMGGYKEVVLRKPRTPINSQNVDALKFLDLVTSLQIADDEVSDVQGKLINIATRCDSNQIQRLLSYYPAKTSKQLIESGMFNVFTS